jgi:rod shape-determining protein MreD
MARAQAGGLGIAMRRRLVPVIVLAAILLIQLTVVNGLALPGGGAPDLVLLCVVALGLTAGPAPGLIAGFCAGLALDLAPPASQLAGQYALVLCLIGYLSGRLRFTVRYSAVLAIIAAAAMAAIGEALSAVLTLALDTPEVTWSIVAQALPASMVYDLALSPFVLLCSVRIAVALGVSFDPLENTPALETGGSAAPVTMAGGVGAPGRARLRQAGQRLAIGGDSRAAASGRWLVGDVAEAAPAVGAIGWLAGPVRSRRARRQQTRLTAMLTGASPRRGAFWVGRRPPGLTPVAWPASPGQRRPVRLRPGSGVAGSTASAARPAPALPPGRPVRLGLAEEQRKRSRAAGRGARWRGPGTGDDRHGLDRHGLAGPGLQSIAFGSGALPGARRAAGTRVPKIAFGSGALPGAGRAAGKRVPKIAFGSGALPGAGRAAGKRVPKIAFGSLSTPTAARGGVRTSGPVRAGRIRFGAPRFAAGPWLAASSAGRGGVSVALHSAGPPSAATGGRAINAGRRYGRKISQPRFGHGGSSRHAARSRRPKTARMSAGRRFGRLPWLRRRGDRSTVWRIASRRVGGYQ